MVSEERSVGHAEGATVVAGGACGRGKYTHEAVAGTARILLFDHGLSNSFSLRLSNEITPRQPATSG